MQLVDKDGKPLGKTVVLRDGDELDSSELHYLQTTGVQIKNSYRMFFIDMDKGTKEEILLPTQEETLEKQKAAERVVQDVFPNINTSE
ncbi:MAG: hypothetical protein JSW41_03395 [Candidatus Aenigmatarchaeota archaeon]|nr:MAG: hypothetical protein JSW41_03395 [Candidatus Aenigmarchaeota archaeon]